MKKTTQIWWSLRAVAMAFILMISGGVLWSCDRPTEPVYENVYDVRSSNFIAIAGLATLEVTDVKALSAVSGGNFTDNYGKPVTQKGVCWSTEPEPGPTAHSGGACTQHGPGNTGFVSQLTELHPAETYYVRAYALNDMEIAFGGEHTFTTRDGRPLVQTNEITNITAFTALLSGQVVDAGISAVVERGFCWIEADNPASQSICEVVDTSGDAFALSVNRFDHATTYVIRAFATNADATSYGNEVTFTTRDGVITLQIDEPVQLGYTSIRVSVTIFDDGGDDITRRGLCWSEQNNPDFNDTCVDIGSGVGFFQETIQLSDFKPYYFRGFAENRVGATYSNEVVKSLDELFGRDRETQVVDVMNPTTGRVWMDRNLGASRVATSSTDALAYGDLYQWGRSADGHEKRNSPTTYTLSSTDQPGHGQFILAPNNPADWRSPQNNNLWQGVNGINNPCPLGYRVPTLAELSAELASWSNNNTAGAFDSPLKLPSAGYRYFLYGTVLDEGTVGRYWSSSVSTSGVTAGVVSFMSNDTNVDATYLRAGGYSVRCIKD